MNKGRLINLEGIEGLGKSTQMPFIADYLFKQGVQSLIKTREPGGTEIAEAIRQVFLAKHTERLTDEAELLLLFAGRAQHVAHLIEPSLLSGAWVLCDRYVDASYAYQGAGRGLPLALIQALEKTVCKNCTPDLTLIFDAPVSLALERIQGRSHTDRLESETAHFFERVRKGYLDLAESNPARYKIVDASQSIEGVQAQLAGILDAFLKEVFREGA